jgi:type IV pilus assembly protein PilO
MKKYPWYVYLILAGLAAGLAYTGYFKPRQAELVRLRGERVAVEAEVATLREKKKQLEAMQTEMGRLAESLRELETIIPQKREIGEMLRTVQQMAIDSELEVVRFVPDPRETVIDFYAEQPVPIEITGAYHNLGTFFDRLLHYPRIFNIDDFTIQGLPGQTETTTIKALFTAKTYYFLEQPVKPAAKKTAGRPAGQVGEIRP